MGPRAHVTQARRAAESARRVYGSAHDRRHQHQQGYALWLPHPAAAGCPLQGPREAGGRNEFASKLFTS